METNEDQPQQPSTAHRLPFLKPDEGEPLRDFLTRLAHAHDWPAEDLARAVELMSSLLSEYLGEEEGKQAGAYIVRALSFTSDAAMALRNMDRYFRALGPATARELASLRENPEHLHFLCTLFSFSQYLSDIAIRHPEYLDWCFRKSRLHQEKTLDRYREQLSEWMALDRERDARRASATLYKQRELLRIGIRDIMEMGNTAQLCHELSNLAQAITEMALDDCLGPMELRHGRPISEVDGKPALYCIYAMGKLGAGELNFSSDLDLIFIYDEEGTTEGCPEGIGGAPVRVISNHEFFVKLSSDVIQYINNRNPEGFLFRVDARLRPEGQNGPLARSRPGYSAYLNTQASLWEKVAYQKARILAGDQGLAEQFDKIVEQFVYTNNVAEYLLPEIARLKRRIDHERLDADSRDLDIKRGVGGIREIEFIVSVIQLLNGEQIPEVRIRSTLRAIRKLVELNLMEPAMAARLEEAYHLYRRIEHTLQMMHESQTHAMPAGREERSVLALRCGFLRPAEFEKTLFDHREYVRATFDKIFNPGGAQGFTLLDYLFMEGEPPKAALEELKSCGLEGLEGFRALQQLAVGSSEFGPSERGRREFARIFPSLMEELRAVAIPNLALRQFHLLLHAARGFSWVYELCVSKPAILKLFLRTLGFGTLLGRQLVTHPEWLDDIFNGDGLYEQRTERAIARLSLPEEHEAALQKLRNFKQLEGFLISVQEILAVTSSTNAAARMTLLAEKVLDEVVRVSTAEALQGTGESALPTRWAIIGLGGLGDRQVHFNGDVDIAIVCESDGEFHGRRTVEWVDQIAQRVITHMAAITPEGQLWKVDARLRPDGKSAPLGATMDRYVRYYREEAGLWEWQALTKARAVAGDLQFGAEVLARLYEVRAALGPIDSLAVQIREMRGRIESSLRIPRNALFDVKSGAGGVIDVEFLVQYLQLSRPTEAAALFTLTTEQAIDVLAESGALSPEDAQFLRAHLLYIRAIQRHHRLLWETTRDLYPAEKEKQESFARGFADQALLLQLPPVEELPERMRRMRELFHRMLSP